MATNDDRSKVLSFLEGLAELEKRFGVFVADAELIDKSGMFEGYLERSGGDLQVVLDGEVLVEFKQND